MNYFVVCTRGCTASRWLSRSLEKVAGIECTHSTGGFTDYESVEYSRDALIESIHREWFGRQSESLAEFLQSNVRDASKQYSGNVHRYQVARHRGLFEAAPQVAVANMVRHPVTWLDSRAALFRSMLEYVPHIGQQLHYTVITNFEQLWPFCKEYGLSLTDPEFMSFVAGLAALYELEKDAQLMEQFPTLAMEDVCSDGASFSRLVSVITGGEKQPTEAELDEVFGAGRLHQHRDAPERTVAQTFHDWPEWKKRLAAPLIVKTGLPRHYQSLGYDWSFLEASPELAQAPVLLKPMEPFGPYWIVADD